MRSTALLGTLALIPLLLVGGPALAETPSPSPSPEPIPTGEPGTFIAYDAQFHSINFDREGETSDQGFYPLTIRIDCDETGCVLSGLPIGQVESVEIENGVGTWSFPAQGSVCSDEPYYGATTLTIEATATGITGELVREPSPDEFCPAQTYQWGTQWTIEGTTVAGDACVLDGVLCPPTPTAEPVAAPATDVTPREGSSPSILSSLPTPDETLAPSQIALAAALTVVLVILMALPTHLLNTAIDSGSDRLASLRRRLRGRPDQPPAEPRRLRGLVPASLGVLAAAVLSCFIDPSFGFDLASVRMLASVILSFALEIALGWALVIWIVRRTTPGATPGFRFAPLTLLIVVATVVFTRVTGFEPGIVFGLVAGVTFGAALAVADKARVALVGLGYGFALAVIAWIAYALTDPSIVFLRESLSALAIAGIAALPIGLVPLRGLAGHEVWLWNRWVWAGAYALGLVGFFLVLLPMPFSWGGVHASLWTWIALYLAYAAAAVTLWLIVIRPWKRDTNEA